MKLLAASHDYLFHFPLFALFLLWEASPKWSGGLEIGLDSLECGKFAQD